MLLNETELRAALEPLLDRLVAERLRLFQLQVGEPKTSSPTAREGKTRAQRFASLLIEDLRLFLALEQAQEYSVGVRAGDWQQRFALELERCRGAFRSRYSDTRAFEEVASRLAELQR